MDKIDEFRGEYYFLSNFWSVPVTFGGITYQNAEAAFQAQKVTDKKVQQAFSVLNPYEAKRRGRRVALRPDWEEVKVGLMQEIVDAKFDQNPDLAEQLLKTKDAYLEEGNCWNDRIWGTVGGEGLNLLGKILMKTRDRLKKQKNTEK
ncbi:MAG: NADAR family protein [Lachnospiraceae bacterium]|nr:NADAR family protein [Lachnospiraceae bacterium]MBR3736521.1 NADAR family protein [Lachnospiraceae bacterium]MBR6850684.1 NADAR family protein [Lachnospiraceae bacterium]